MTCLGSGSAGNCYLLHDEEQCLVIEAGVPFKEVKRALDFNIEKIVGVIVSHEHADHAKYVNEYIKAGIPVLRLWEHENPRRIPSFWYGRFRIDCFPLVHDVPCFGFRIEHHSIGRLLFATDTMYIRFTFRNINHIMIECNHSRELLEKCYNKELADRIKATHMGCGTCLDAININASIDSLKSVCLIHLSDRASDADAFKSGVRKHVRCPVYVADKGLEYEL